MEEIWNTDNSTMLTWPTTVTTTTKRPQTPKDQLPAPAAPSAVIFKLCTSFVQKICNAFTEESTADKTALSGRHPTNPTQPPHRKPSNHTSPTPLLKGHTNPPLTPPHYREVLPRKKKRYYQGFIQDFGWGGGEKHVGSAPPLCGPTLPHPLLFPSQPLVSSRDPDQPKIKVSWSVG